MEDAFNWPGAFALTIGASLILYALMRLLERDDDTPEPMSDFDGDDR